MFDRFFWLIAFVGVAFALFILTVFCNMNVQKADFTFCNNDEVKTIDPALAAGNPEGNIVSALFEGLCAWDPQTLKPIPGVAERWTISPDGKTYTFYLRRNARWSNGDPVTAADFLYSFRRILHPATSGEYSYELWYVPGAKEYSTGTVQPGDRVEISLPYALGPDNQKPRIRKNPLTAIVPDLHGILREIRTPQTDPKSDSNTESANADMSAAAIYVIELANGQTVEFQKQPQQSTAKSSEISFEISSSAEPLPRDYLWILPDFDEIPIRLRDAYTLEIELAHPVPYFLNLMGFYPMFPVNRRCVERFGMPGWTRCEHLVCNGPFVMESRRIRDRIRLRRNPYYWDRDNVGCETIDCLAVKSAVTSLNLYLAGDCDWIPVVPPEIAKELRARPEKDYVGEPFFATYFYVLNVNTPCLQDARVRQALNLALDKREIVEKVTRGGQVPADSLVPPLDRAAYRVPEGQTREQKIERARALLAEAGYPAGQGFPTVEILYNTSESHEAIALLIQHQWKKSLGINARIQNQEWADYLAKRKSRDYMIARAGWTGDYVDPLTFLLTFQSESPMNQTGWADPQFDALLNRAQQEPNPDKRLEILAQAQKILNEQAPVIPLYYYSSQAMVRSNVRGWYPNLLDTHPLKNIRVEKKQ